VACSRWGLIVLATLASAAVLTASAGAVTQGSRGVNVSTRADVVLYLTSLGIDAHGIVVQRGSHNYAGANCPGKGWTCTTAKRVLQIASSKGDDNSFQCSASTAFGGSANAPTECTIVQVSSGGDNVARCTEHSGDAVGQSCRIAQSNTTGANRIQVEQHVNTNDGASQLATQYAGSTQVNGSGRNDVQISQQLQLQAKSVDATGTQTQDGHQAASVTQSSDTGNNTAQVNQSMQLKADAKGGPSIEQDQNTDGSINTNTGVRQNSNSGSNTAQVNQSNQYDEHIGQADTGSQTQGDPGGGLNVFFDQSSTGLSKIDAHQSEQQNMHSEHVGSLSQTQYGPVWADPSQGSNPGDTYNIDQRSQQRGDSSPDQSNQLVAECNTSGNCTVNQTTQEQGQNTNNSCTGSSCFTGIIVTTGEGGTTSTTCNGEDSEFSCPGNEPPPPPPPFSECGLSCDVIGNRG